MNFCPQCRTDLAMQTVDGDERLACVADECNFVHWNNPIPVVAGIVEFQGRIVMAHNVAWPRKFYSIITGFLEQGETPEQSIIRETKEELNLEAQSVELVGAYGFEQMNQVIIAYHVPATGDIQLNEELDDFRLVPPEQLQPWDFGTGLAIKDFMAKRGY